MTSLLSTVCQIASDGGGGMRTEIFNAFDNSSSSRPYNVRLESRQRTHRLRAFEYSQRLGPLTGLEIHICLLAGCLLSTYVPRALPNLIVRTPL